MLIDFSTDIRNDRLLAVKTRIDAGSGAGKMLFYSSPKPVAGTPITTQTLLGTARFSDPCGTLANQVLSFTFDADILADNEGDIAFVRITDSDDNFCCDMDATINGGGGAVLLDALHTYVGGTIRVISASFSEP